MMKTNEGSVYFDLDGDEFNHDELTKFLGIDPSRIVVKGETVSGRQPKKSYWQLSTENVVNDYIDIYEMASSIIYKLKAKKDLIVEAKSKFNLTARLEVVLMISSNEKPAIGFEVGTIKFLSEVGALIDIDTYVKGQV